MKKNKAKKINIPLAAYGFPPYNNINYVYDGPSYSRTMTLPELIVTPLIYGNQILPELVVESVSPNTKYKANEEFEKQYDTEVKRQRRVLDPLYKPKNPNSSQFDSKKQQEIRNQIQNLAISLPEWNPLAYYNYNNADINQPIQLQQNGKDIVSRYNDLQQNPFTVYQTGFHAVNTPQIQSVEKVSSNQKQSNLSKKKSNSVKPITDASSTLNNLNIRLKNGLEYPYQSNDYISMTNPFGYISPLDALSFNIPSQNNNIQSNQPLSYRTPTIPIDNNVDINPNQITRYNPFAISTDLNNPSNSNNANDSDNLNNSNNSSLFNTTDTTSPYDTKKTNWKNVLSKGWNVLSGFLPTAGELLGMYSQIKGGNDITRNSYKAFAMTQPNENYYEHYGEKGIKAIEQQRQAIENNREHALNELDKQISANRYNNHNNARGINTLRMGDALTDMIKYNVQNQINHNASQQEYNLLNTLSGLLNQKDRMYMAGEEQRDLFNRQDLDNFFTNRARDLATQSAIRQNIAKNWNEIQRQRAMQNLINLQSLFGFGINGKTGSLSSTKRK